MKVAIAVTLLQLRDVVTRPRQVTWRVVSRDTSVDRVMRIRYQNGAWGRRFDINTFPPTLTTLDCNLHKKGPSKTIKNCNFYKLGYTGIL